jgi:hypothetical protein
MRSVSYQRKVCWLIICMCIAPPLLGNGSVNIFPGSFLYGPSRIKGNFQFLGVGWDWVHSVRRPLIGLLYQLRMIDDDECGAVGGMRICRGNRSTWRKPAPVPLCPPQIPHTRIIYLLWSAIYFVVNFTILLRYYDTSIHRYFDTTSKHRAGWSSGNALELYSRDYRFESRQWSPLSWLRFFMDFLSPYRENFWQIRSNWSFNRRPSVRRYPAQSRHWKRPRKPRTCIIRRRMTGRFMHREGSGQK